MYPIAKAMLSIMCEEAKKEMRTMDQTPLGSWSCAVTCADGVWMTRGFHSKNATFSVRNYLNGVLLYYKHLFFYVVETVLLRKNSIRVLQRVLKGMLLSVHLEKQKRGHVH